MAVNDRGMYHTNSGWINGLVRAQYDTNGDVVADAHNGGAGNGEDELVTSVDVLLLGPSASGVRTGVTRGTSANQFEFTDTLVTGV